MENDLKDVGFIDDAIFLLEHAIGCEEHAKQNYIITKKEKWLDILTKIRRERSKLMYELIPKTGDETYCFCKHLLGRAMARKELGDRYLEDKDKEKAKICFELAGLYEQLFKFLIGGKKWDSKKK